MHHDLLVSEVKGLLELHEILSSQSEQTNESCLISYCIKVKKAMSKVKRLCYCAETPIKFQSPRQQITKRQSTLLNSTNYLEQLMKEINS